MSLIHIQDLNKHFKGLFAISYRVWTLGVNSYTGTGS